MVDHVRFGKLVADESMDSGFRLVDDNFVICAAHYGCDKLIQCSPFMDKNGEVLFEGDIVISRNNKEKGVICQGKNGSWYAKWRIGISASNFNKLRCTGSIYLKDGE